MHAYAKSNLTASSLAIGANVSSKFIPSS